VKKLGLIALVIIGLSAYEYVNKGRVSWPESVYSGLVNTVEEYALRPEAAWRRASEKLNDLVPTELSPASFDIVGRVVRVADGDTISVLDGNKDQYKIRFYGIDTPEYDQPHGGAASKALAQRLANKTVGVVVKDIDRLGRTVGMVYLDGVNINVEMVKAGHAWWYQHYAESNRALKMAQGYAQSHHLGIWKTVDPIPPWDWRRGKR
jgi:endonuclease YncB( thermonuclease family)